MIGITRGKGKAKDGRMEKKMEGREKLERKKKRKRFTMSCVVGKNERSHCQIAS